MDRSEDVLAHDALADQNSILKVVSAPRHDRTEDITPEGYLTHVCRGAIGNGFTHVQDLSFFDNGLLTDTGALVRPHKFHQFVGIDAAVLGLYRHALSRNPNHRTAPAR